MKYLDENKKIYEKTNRIVFNEKNDYLKAVDSNSIDMVLTFRNSHNWIKFGNIKDVYKSFHRVLKKGGTLGVVQHRAKKNDSPEKSADTGYVPESYLINLIEEAGFELVKKSDVNANSKDKKNPDILNYLGFTLRKTGKLEEAEKYYLEGLKIKPDHNGINEYLGELYVKTGRIELAKERLAVLKNCNCEEYAELKEVIEKK